MGDLPMADGTELGGKQGHDGDRLSIQSHKFHLIPLAILMDQNHSPNISLFQSIFRQIDRQYNAVQFLYLFIIRQFHNLSL